MNAELEQYTLNAMINDKEIRELVLKRLRKDHFNLENRELFLFLQVIYLEDIDTPAESYVSKLKDHNLLNTYIDVGNNPILGVYSDRNIDELHREYLNDQYKLHLSFDPDKAFEYYKQLKDYEIIGEDAIYPKEMIRKEIQEAINDGLSMELYKTGLIDDCYQIIKKQTTVITGSPSSGKSNFMDAIAVNLAHKYGWKFLVFSPENQPLKLHLMDIARKFDGFPVMGTKKPSEDIENFILNHFTFINTNVVDHNIDFIISLAKTKEFDGLIIDPWNELEITEENEGRFISQSLSKLKSFSYRKNCHNFIIAHPTKLRKSLSGIYEGQYPPATAYDIDGSAKWYSKPDNILSIWRDVKNNSVEVHVQKIKFEGVTGHRGKKELSFIPETGGYV